MGGVSRLGAGSGRCSGAGVRAQVAREHACLGATRSRGRPTAPARGA